ncbi:MAG: flagellar motor switch protein FliM [Bacillota bacterium]
MQEVLSQAEIDRLLQALSTGEVTVEEMRETAQEVVAKPYDFRRPNKFSKDQLRTLQMLHDNYARILTSFLSSYLRFNISVQVNSVDQFTFDEFLRSVPTPTVLTIFSVEPLKGLAVMETNAYFLFPVLDLLLGGSGGTPARLREFTDIELAVARRLNAKILEKLDLAWQDIFPVKARVESLETNPRLQQVISPGEVVAVITFATAVHGAPPGLINLCFPFTLLDPMLARLASFYRYAQAAPPGEEEIGRLAYWLERALVELTVVTGETEITVREFLQLQPGDVLPLPRRADEDMDLLVEGLKKFAVQAGTLGRARAVQVTGLREVEEKVG